MKARAPHGAVAATTNTMHHAPGIRVPDLSITLYKLLRPTWE